MEGNSRNSDNPCKHFDLYITWKISNPPLNSLQLGAILKTIATHDALTTVKILTKIDNFRKWRSSITFTISRCSKRVQISLRSSLRPLTLNQNFDSEVLIISMARGSRDTLSWCYMGILGLWQLWYRRNVTTVSIFVSWELGRILIFWLSWRSCNLHNPTPRDIHKPARKPGISVSEI